MQERGRKSSRRVDESRHRSHSSRSGQGPSSSQRSKSKPRNYLEQRNRIIEENKKKSQKKITKQALRPKPKKTAVKAIKLPKPIVVPSSQKSQRPILKKTAVGALKSPNLLTQKGESDAQYLSFIIASTVALGLILVSSLDVLLSEGILFFYLGLLLLKRPSLYSRGRYFDWIAFGVIAYGAGACFFKLPFFYSDWRSTALDGYGLNFGFLNSITPDASFEAWLRIVACITLFYHIGHWKINELGRSRFFSYIIALALLLGFIDLVLGHEPLSFLIPAENLFTPIQAYGVNLSLFLLIAAVVAWALFFDSYLNRHKQLLASFSFIGLVVILSLLIKENAVFSLLLYFLVAYALLIRMWIKRSSGFYSYTVALLPGILFLLWLYLNPTVQQSLKTIILEPLLAQFLALQQVASAQLESFSLMGKGIATANVLLAQYTEHYLYQSPLANRSFNLLYFVNDFGLLGLVALFVGLLYWTWKCACTVRSSHSFQKGLAFIPSLMLVIFLLHFLYGNLSIGTGLILLMLIFYDLSLRVKGMKRSAQACLLGKKVCRLIGVFSVFIGISNFCVSIFNLPVHSEVRYRLGMGAEQDHALIQEAILYRDFTLDPAYLPPFDPNTHLFEAAQAIRAGKSFSEVELHIQRSSFLNPNLQDQLLEWGYLLEAYDLSLATEMWYAYFAEDPQNRLLSYKELLFYAEANYELLLKLNPVARLSLNYSLEYMKFLNKIDFQRFIQADLAMDFSRVDPANRFQLMRRFLEYGMFDVFERYQSLYQAQIDNFFLLEAIKEKEQANFDRALEILRKNIRSKSFKHFEAKADKKYIPRVFLQNNPDLEMGTILVQQAVENESYSEALQYVDHLLTLSKPPLYIHYWRAELLFRSGNLVDSWFAFMTYVDAAKVRHMFNQSYTNQ